MYILESVNKKNILNSFKNFIAEFPQTKSPINVIINMLIDGTSLLTQGQNRPYSKHYPILDSINSRIKDFLDDNMTLIENELPSIYIEKIFSKLNKTYSRLMNEETKIMFINAILERASFISRYAKDYSLREVKDGNSLEDIRVYLQNLIMPFSLLFYLRLFIKFSGFNELSSILETLEKKVYNDQISDLYNEFINSLFDYMKKQDEKNMQRLSNYRVFSNENIDVFKVDSSHQLCIIAGKGTNWCVANRNDSHYREYSSYGDMYAFIFKKLKNKYDGLGPEKALLTIKNKTRDFKNVFDSDRFNFLIEKYKNFNFNSIDDLRVDYKIIYMPNLENADKLYTLHDKLHNGKRYNIDVTKEFIDLIKKYDSQFQSLKNIFNTLFFYERRMEKEIVKYLNDETVNYMSKNFKFNFSESEKGSFVHELEIIIDKKLRKIFRDYIKTVFDISNLQNVSSISKVLPIFKVLVQFAKDYFNALSLDPLEMNFFAIIILPVFFMKDDPDNFIIRKTVFDDFALFEKFYIALDKSPKESLAALFNNLYVLRNSQNNAFKLDNTNESYYNQLVDLMFEWPGIYDAFFKGVSKNPLSVENKPVIEEIYNKLKKLTNFFLSLNMIEFINFNSYIITTLEHIFNINVKKHDPETASLIKDFFYFLAERELNKVFLLNKILEDYLEIPSTETVSLVNMKGTYEYFEVPDFYRTFYRKIRDSEDIHAIMEILNYYGVNIYSTHNYKVSIKITPETYFRLEEIFSRTWKQFYQEGLFKKEDIPYLISTVDIITSDYEKERNTDMIILSNVKSISYEDFKYFFYKKGLSFLKSLT